MPDYPKTTGELVTVKDPADNTTKLLDTLIQLLRNADKSTLQALQTLTETVQNLSGQAWKNNQTNLPASNNAFDIGSASRMIKSIYSMGMTLGREGYEWEINDTDGYITLPNGLLLSFGKITSDTSSDKFMAVLFPKPYSTNVISVATGMEHATEDSASAHGFIKNNSVTLSGFSVGTFNKNTLRYTYWLAIGY